MKQLKYVTSIIVLVFLAFAGNTAVAQSGFTSNVLLSDKELSTDGTVLVDDDTALELLTETAKSIDFANAANESDEIYYSVKQDYYLYLATEVNTGIGIKTALEASGPQLAYYLNKFKSDFGVDAIVIYNETLDLLEQ